MKGFKRLLPVALLFILVFPACGSVRQSTEDEKVYRALVAHYFVGSTQFLYVIDEYTSVGLEYNKTLDTMLHPVQGEGFELTQETINDFIAKKSAPSQLIADMDLGVKYVLLLQTEKTEIQKTQPDLELALREKYPDSSVMLLSFSRVGFNQEQTQALVYFHFRFAHSGSGNYCVLEKENGRWVWKDCVAGGWKEDY